MSQIDDYLNSLSTEQQHILQHIRQLVHKQVPETQELISYGIPTFKYNGKLLFHFAGFKNHMSIFPGALAVQMLGEELKEYKVSKGTIQFTATNKPSDAFIKKLIDLRLKDITK